MPIIEMINGGKKGKKYKTMKGVERLIKYITKPEKTNELVCGGVHCNVSTAYEEFVLTKLMYNKLPKPQDTSNRQVIHFVQSFAADDNISPEVAKEIADELVKHKQFEGFQMVYAVHIDKEHLHTHFVVNTCNYDTGRAWQMGSKELQDLKDFSDSIAQEHGLSVIKEHEKTKEYMHKNAQQYRSEQKNIGWKKQVFDDAKVCKMAATSKEDFVSKMEQLGYKIRWEENRKDITFTNNSGKKINSDKLGYPKKGYAPFTKVNLETQFKINIDLQKKQKNLENEILGDKLINLANKLTRQSDMNFNKADMYKHLEGNALKEKIKEMEKGSGVWENEQ